MAYKVMGGPFYQLDVHTKYIFHEVFIHLTIRVV